MKVSYSRVQAVTSVGAAEAAAALRDAGYQVTVLDPPGPEISGVIVARILDVLPHPDADRLRLADVEFGGLETRVVCGAPNIEPGMVVPFAPAGATLPGGFTLERRTIRGVISDGMLCSARELGLSDDHEGILAISAEVATGTDVHAVLPLGEVVLEIEPGTTDGAAPSVSEVARTLIDALDLPPLLAPAEPEA